MRHGVRSPLSGAGSMPCSRRILAMVLLATVWPRFERAPRIRVYPHRGFDCAIPTTSSLISAMTRGRPSCFRQPSEDIYKVTPGVKCLPEQAESPRPDWVKFQGGMMILFSDGPKVIRHKINAMN